MTRNFGSNTGSPDNLFTRKQYYHKFYYSATRIGEADRPPNDWHSVSASEISDNNALPVGDFRSSAAAATLRHNQVDPSAINPRHQFAEAIDPQPFSGAVRVYFACLNVKAEMRGVGPEIANDGVRPVMALDDFLDEVRLALFKWSRGNWRQRRFGFWQFGACLEV